LRKKSFEDGESIEFSGKAIVALAKDPFVIRKTGKVLLTADLAREYGFVDDNGKINGDMRTVNKSGWLLGLGSAVTVLPDWVRIPSPVFHMMGYKF